jgi:presenilin-like A22 family membrane protease
MSRSIKTLAPVVVMLIFLMAVQLLALYITPPQVISSPPPEEKNVNQEPASLSFPIFLVLIILAITALLLFFVVILKQEWIIECFIWISMAICIYYVVSAFLRPQVPFLGPQISALVLTFGLFILLRLYPEWYVIDAFCILICAAISSVFGMNMYVFPALLLLIIMAIYDSISVYKTTHMVLLAEIIIKIKAPLLFVLPKRMGYSFRRDKNSIASKKDRMSHAYFLGLGDAIIPTILIISANHWLEVDPRYIYFGINLPALGAMIGTYLGFLLLMVALSDRYHAGLLFLNSGAILGLFAGCFISGIWHF